MYDAIRYRSTHPTRLFDCTSLPTGGMAAHRIGDVMPDGTVYAGISPTNAKPMYSTPKDTGLCAEWNKAMDHAAKLDAHGYTDWRVPTKAELHELFKHRAAIGAFDESGSCPACWYWSSSQYFEFNAWVQRFSDGDRNLFNASVTVASLRPVRG